MSRRHADPIEVRLRPQLSCRVQMSDRARVSEYARDGTPVALLDPISDSVGPGLVSDSVDPKAGDPNAVGHGVTDPSMTPEEPVAAEPEQFLWAGRLYVVREVLHRWVEAGAWWLRASDTPAAERTVWRVEAAAGRHGRVGVYDLCLEQPQGRWSLTRVLD